MLEFLQVLSMFLAAVVMAFALAHAAELPGKMRLDKETYLAVQTIYYPGFTVGAISEPASIVATLILLVCTPREDPAFWWVLAALVGLVATHAVYWIVTHPVNGFWLKDQRLTGLGAGFFSLGTGKRPPSGSAEPEKWKSLRNRWEHSHLVRAVLAMLSLILLLVSGAR